MVQIHYPNRPLSHYDLHHPSTCRAERWDHGGEKFLFLLQEKKNKKKIKKILSDKRNMNNKSRELLPSKLKYIIHELRKNKSFKNVIEYSNSPYN